MTGTNTSSSRMAMTLPNTESICTRNAVVHCLTFPPPSSGADASVGGATM